MLVITIIYNLTTYLYGASRKPAWRHARQSVSLRVGQTDAMWSAVGPGSRARKHVDSAIECREPHSAAQIMSHPCARLEAPGDERTCSRFSYQDPACVWVRPDQDLVVPESFSYQNPFRTRILFIPGSCMFMGSTRSGPCFQGARSPKIQAGNSPGNSTGRILVCEIFVQTMATLTNRRKTARAYSACLSLPYRARPEIARYH